MNIIFIFFIIILLFVIVKKKNTHFTQFNPPVKNLNCVKNQTQNINEPNINLSSFNQQTS